jgi:hypothetical protein
MPCVAISGKHQAKCILELKGNLLKGKEISNDGLFCPK